MRRKDAATVPDVTDPTAGNHILTVIPALPAAFLPPAGAMLLALESTMTVRRPSPFRHLLPLLALAAFAAPGHADTTGTLDSAFGSSGAVVDVWGASAATATAVVLSTSGSTSSSLLVAGLDTNGGVNHLVLKRYLSTGVTDVANFVSPPTGYSFYAPQSALVTQETRVAMAVQSDGKPVCTCLALNTSSTQAVLVLVRFTTAGALDTTFDGDGIAILTLPYVPTAVTGLAIDGNGGFLVCGQAKNSSNVAVFTLARANAAGTLDTTFGSSGILQPSLGDNSGAESAATGIVWQSDGKLVISGWAWTTVTSSPTVRKAMLAVRSSASGTLDSTFGSSGVTLAPLGYGDAIANTVVVQADGKIALAGSGVNSSSTTVATVLRLTSAGVADSTFGSSGAVLSALGSSSSRATCLAQYSDARLVIGGYASTSTTTGFCLARYSTDGILDTTVGSSGLAAFNTGSQAAGGIALVSTYAYLAGGGTSSSSAASFTTLRVLLAATSDSGSSSDDSGSPYINTSCGLGSGVALGGLLVLGALLRLRLRRR